MRHLLRFLAVAILLTALMTLAGCGEDSTPQGRVVKGPTYGATVTYSDGTTAVTDANGYYPDKGLSVTTTGGFYTDMNGVVRPAPNMAAPAGFTFVTPLTTIYTNASAADKAALETLVGGLTNINSAVVGTVTASNELVAKLNETIGEVLTQFITYGATATPAYLANVATAVVALPAATITGVGGGATLSNDVANAAGSTLTAPQIVTVTAKATVISNATIINATVPTTAPAATTGSAGGTGAI